VAYQIVCYVPESHVDSVKQAMFDAGAGNVAGYSHCCWQTLGQGQYRPGVEAKPYVGQANQLATVQEIKLEIFCPQAKVAGVLRAMRQAHPYEVPAYFVLQHCGEFDEC